MCLLVKIYDYPPMIFNTSDKAFKKHKRQYAKEFADIINQLDRECVLISVALPPHSMDMAITSPRLRQAFLFYCYIKEFKNNQEFYHKYVYPKYKLNNLLEPKIELERK